jgi:hypothetical protein
MDGAHRIVRGRLRVLDLGSPASLRGHRLSVAETLPETVTFSLRPCLPSASSLQRGARRDLDRAFHQDEADDRRRVSFCLAPRRTARPASSVFTVSFASTRRTDTSAIGDPSVRSRTTPGSSPFALQWFLRGGRFLRPAHAPR